MSTVTKLLPYGLVTAGLVMSFLCDGCFMSKVVKAVTLLSAGYLFRKYMKGGVYRGKERIEGKTVIITGCNTGIGKETARELARRGGRIIMACRDLEKAKMAREEIVTDTGNPNVIVMKLDLSSFESIKEFAQAINETEPRIDILINNAGVMMCPKMLTKDGLEMQIGVNHFGHFYLTNLLLDKLKASTPSRIIIVSSLAHIFGKIDFDDINSTKRYKPSDAYAQSKLANILHMRQLVKVLEGTGVTVYSLHPGSVDTELQRHFTILQYSIIKVLFYPVKFMFFKTPIEGAQTTLYAALDPALETVTGKYFSDCKEKLPAPRALVEEDAQKLWNLSLTITQENKQS
ncbi:retinol dehydrogenase 12-like [Physella acuta]|uniref:retinol dehydrogenase 12-like n=1 Tax=Physella acuta TaxID=109671 RepID=UPI0027DD97D8|nr:retinol dehydrogenase 12-like [Physella acuta]XP_059155009.1 retinol dehydrogenase 12-like [Physella acuta]XP_059155010.1 retinol dehydrogenase 12-like [Physella acuta]XP_059155011.1 retinol dehydrogenase 12-like [Physella acuta]